MDDALVVYDEHDTELLAEAGELAAGVGAAVTVLVTMAPDAFDEARRAVDAEAEADDVLPLDGATTAARETVPATGAVTDAYADLDLEWEVLAVRVDEDDHAAARVLNVAHGRGVDHVFVTGEERSPTGKAVFGDRAQTITLNFEGPVTTLLH